MSNSLCLGNIHDASTANPTARSAQPCDGELPEDRGADDATMAKATNNPIAWKTATATRNTTIPSSSASRMIAATQ